MRVVPVHPVWPGDGKGMVSYEKEKNKEDSGIPRRDAVSFCAGSGAAALQLHRRRQGGSDLLL